MCVQIEGEHHRATAMPLPGLPLLDFHLMTALRIAEPRE
jgi:hypothetical protein